MIRATVLLHADNPTTVDETLERVRDACPETVTVHRVVTAYDGLVIAGADTERDLANLVARLQAVDGVARTLTLVHVPEEPTP